MIKEQPPKWWICPICGFDAKKFEPRPECQVGAMRFHKALHESGRINED